MHLQSNKPLRFFLSRRRGIKLRSYGLSFHELHQQFALFLVVGTGRIEVARGLVSASVASRVMEVNSSRSKGRGSGQAASVRPFTRALPRDLTSHAPWEQGLTRTSDEARGKTGRWNAA
ncbi:hypothetical protein AVEN_167853-1 [Araneus ventricosus]|uniref:Uncharacterized protein n=1 Tax=Araneus ventricosus TaxID=182803 RepID=A0A4Y2TUQ7_ARAVE|nr:hypothetical protein AVEN_167853-1 [Araneus ventricosus]